MIIQTKPEPYCPICGARMILRRPKSFQDWDPFWGCNNYPDCKGTRDIDSDGKPGLTESELYQKNQDSIWWIELEKQELEEE